MRPRRRRRVAVAADRPAARQRRQVRPVRVARQRRARRVVALRAAVRPAAEHRVPRVRRDRRRALPVVVAVVDPAAPERPAAHGHRRVAAGVAERHAPRQIDRPVDVRRRRRRRVAVGAEIAAPVSVVRCGPCEFVVMLADVLPWHSVQFVSAVPQVYGAIAAALCPLLWQALIPQVPNVPPATCTASAPAGVYVKVSVTEPFPCVLTVAAV